jgi:ribosomal protein S14
MRHLIIKDRRRRRNAYQREPINIFLQSLSRALPSYTPKRFHGVGNRAVNRCLLTSRSKAVFRFFALERRCLRYKLSFARFCGVRRVIW